MIATGSSFSHHVIDYNRCPPEEWGSGAFVLPKLSPVLQEFWHRAVPYQDKRSDVGHGEIVTWFSLCLASYHALSPDETLIAIAAAIGHDIGWSQIDDIDSRFSAVMKGRFSEDPHTQDASREAERALRVEHQELGAALTRALLGESFPGIDAVCEIIRDHDTREHSPSRPAAVLWDADILWRVTIPGRAAGLRQTGVTAPQWLSTARRELQVSRKKLQTEIALQVGTREYDNSVEYLSRR